ncbi:ABC transporter permease subunit [Paenibacillus oryzisoli]|uniref:ABC transporter permease n=1 Tax=Paenibacillus oryzisoli TaxID=1850517 RepID=UPI003D26A8F5
MIEQTASAPASANVTRRKWDRKRFRQNVPIMLMFLPALVFFIIFKYLPIGGLIIAFKNYNFMDGVLASPWVGLKNFDVLFTQPQMLRILRNTFVLSFLQVVIGFPFPILLAILMNEARKMWFKRFVQTVVYLPHFLNWVIVGSFVLIIFAQQNGLLNHYIEKLFGNPFPFLYKEHSWIGIFIGSSVWKEMGWNAIIYLAALASVDPSLYEAASMDGAGKLRQIWSITLPAIMPTVAIMFILSVGHVMEVGFDQVYMLQNPAVSDIAEVISTWNFKVGINGGQFSLAAAMGLFESFVALVLVLGANFGAKRFGQSLW